VPDTPHEEQLATTGDAPRRRRWWQRTWFKVVVCVAIVCVAGLVIAAEYLIHNAEPILRGRVVDTLSAHFHSPVELDHLGISLIKGVRIGSTGVEVEGDGLRIRYLAGADQPQTDSNAPMLSVRHFAFHTRLRGLLRQPTRIFEVDVDGMDLHIPPASARGAMFGSKGGKHQPKITLLVSHIRCKNVRLFIDTTKPGKEPLEFDIQRLDLQDVGQSQPFTYQAELINPKPIGEIHAEGHFGPWNVEDPRGTALDGSYSFQHVDLNSIKGIGGTLSSRGKFGGPLERITIDGETDTPNFSLDESDHPMPLHTVFHAYVNGTDGDTYLDPVQARLERSDFTAKGKVVRVNGQGHDIDLEVNVPNGRMQDFLELGVKTRPPLMNGVIAMKAHLEIPPGDERVPQKIQLAGTFQLHNVRFNDPRFQDKVDGLSARAQGKPKEVAAFSTDREAEVSSAMSASFSLGHGLMTVNDLRYQIPGALVLLNGVYSLDGNVFEFKGHVRTEATASQMVTGWKSWLLKPVDPFLKKNGAGLQLPISISGTQGDVHFGLALHGSAEESSGQMAQQLKENRQSMLADAKAKRERDKADREQKKADASTDGKQAKEQKKADKERRKAERHEAETQAQQQDNQEDNPPPPDSSSEPSLHKRPPASPQR